MISVERTYTFEAAHSLPRVPPTHKCFNMHGHTYTVVCRFTRPLDDRMGWVMDFGDIDKMVAPIIAQLDHTNLKLVVENPTAENLALWLVGRITTSLTGLTRLEVQETARGRVIWEP